MNVRPAADPNQNIAKRIQNCAVRSISLQTNSGRAMRAAAAPEGGWTR